MKIPDAIRTQRLVIRPFQDGDLAPYLEFMTDPEATRYLLLDPEQKTAAGARALFDFVRASYGGDEPIWALAMATPADGYIGSCGMSPIDGAVVECYFSLLPRHQKCGYATEATTALIGHLLGNGFTTEVRAYMSPENPNSAGVARRAGMTHRGIQKHPGFGNEGLLYAITREEWERKHGDDRTDRPA